MLGWIIYNHSKTELKPESYNLNRLIDEGYKIGIDLKIISPEQFDLIVSKENRKSILINQNNASLPDFILPRMGASTTYNVLSILRHLERLGVVCINNSISIDTARDKFFTHQILAENLLPVPKTLLVKFPFDINFIEKNFDYPIIIKPIYGTQGKGVFLAENKNSFEDIMNLISVTNSNMNIILQEFIKTSYGKDLRVFVVGNKVVACMLRTSQSSFKANFCLGSYVSAFQLTPQIEDLALKTTKILGLDIAGIDILFDKEEFKICEANSSPGFKGIELCCDVNIPKEIFNFLMKKLNAYRLQGHFNLT